MTANFRRCLALWLAAAVWHSCSLAAHAAPDLARLKHAGEVSAAGPVFIDGAETISGATFFSGSEVQTGASGRAGLSLGTQGRAGLMPRSSLKLDFGGGQITGALALGGVRISKPEGVSAAITTPGGSVAAASEESAVFVVKYERGRTEVEAEAGRVVFSLKGKAVEVGAGERYAAGQERPDRSDGLTGREKAAIAIGAGGLLALLAILLSGSRDELPEEEPCGPITLSPVDNPPC